MPVHIVLATPAPEAWQVCVPTALRYKSLASFVRDQELADWLVAWKGPQLLPSALKTFCAR